MNKRKHEIKEGERGRKTEEKKKSVEFLAPF
jgi:hypothetical protein